MRKKIKFPIKQIIIVISLLGAFFALLFLLQQTAIANSDQVNNVRYARLMKIIAYFDRQIEKNPPSSEARHSFEYRKKYYIWQVTELAKPTEPQGVMVPRKQTSIALATETALHYTPMPTPTRVTGILEDPEHNRYVSGEIKIAFHFWIGKVGETYATVYSGYLWDDPNQGVIYVLVERPHKWLKFPTPEKMGNIEIVDFKGSILTFSNEKGERIFFDVARLQFTNSAVEQISTATVNFRTYETPYPGP